MLLSARWTSLFRLRESPSGHGITRQNSSLHTSSCCLWLAAPYCHLRVRIKQANLNANPSLLACPVVWWKTRLQGSCYFFATILCPLMEIELPWTLKSLRLAHLSYRGRKQNFSEYLIGSSHEWGHLHGGCVLCLLRTWQSLCLFKSNNLFSSKIT